MDEQVEALAAAIHDAFHSPNLGTDLEAWMAGPQTEGFAFPWILLEESDAKENFRRAARAVLTHMAAVDG